MSEADVLKALNIVASAMSPLTEDERTRVLTATASLYSVSVATGRRAPNERSAGDGEQPDEAENTLTDFVDLFDRANPKTDVDRAAVAAYWHQLIAGNGTWQSQPLNVALKDLGYPLKNVTDCLNSLQTRKPSWVRQVSKSGQSRQGRKTYKMTQAGINGVRAMLGKTPTADEDED
jgi:hypothetical protein